MAICFISLAGVAQPKMPNHLARQVDSLKLLLDRADTLTSDELWKSEETNVNDSIADLLIRLLSDTAITRYNLDTLLKHPFLGITHSKDKRLWIFDWYENTGGSFQSCLSVVHYRTHLNKPRAIYNSYFNEEGFSMGGWMTKIVRLPHPAKALYLCMQTVRACNTCCVEVASVIELTRDSIDFNYPAFTVDSNETRKNQNIYSLDARCGDILKFEYDPGSATINYEYETDDNTPVSQEEARKVKGKLQWNGKAFNETSRKQR